MKRIVYKAIITAVLMFGVVALVMFCNGQTLGDRCSIDNEYDSDEWCQCVDSMNGNK